MRASIGVAMRQPVVGIASAWKQADPARYKEKQRAKARMEVSTMARGTAKQARGVNTRA